VQPDEGVVRGAPVTGRRRAPDGGEPPELVAFCVAVHPHLVGALTLHLGDRAVAEELAQESLVRIWQRWDEVGTYDSPRAWAFRVAYNLANSGLRRRAAERRARTRLEAAPADGVDGSTWAEHLAVREAVAALPDRQRTAVVLRFFAGLSVDEAAAAMGCPAGTVKSLVHRAVAALRASLGDAVTATVPDDHPTAEVTGA
jgi:RNA polymerase sigma-70 factor (sigma-E family)